MKNLKQRVLTGAMAGVLAVSLAVPAFASKSTKVTGTYKEITIAAVVPTTGTATINPYGLPVNVTKSDDSTVTISKQQITTMPLSIKNQSIVDLDINATVSGVIKTGSTMTLSAASTESDTTKTAFVALQVVALDNAELATEDTDALADKLIDLAVDDSTWADVEAGAVVEANKTNASTATLATIKAAELDENGEFSKYAKDSIALFRLAGDCVKAPKKGTGATQTDDPWTSKDGFDATIVFTLTPAEAEEEAPTPGA